jgi:hypothetical protein
MDYTGVGVADPSKGVLAGSYGGSAYYVARGLGQRLCLIEATPGAGVGATCSIFDPNRKGAEEIIPLVAPAQNGAVRVAAIVPDGFSTAVAGARTSAVSRNVFVAELEPGESQITLEGSRGKVQQSIAALLMP